MVLLDGRRHNPGDPDSVAAHFHERGFAIFIEKCGFQGFRILRAEIEHVANFDAALDRERAIARRREIALDHVAQICDQCGFGKVPSPVHTNEVGVFVVCATHEIVHVRDGTVCDDGDRPNGGDWAEISRLAAEMFGDLFLGGEPVSFVQPRHLARLDLVEFVIPADEEKPDPDLARFRLGRQHQRLDRLGERNAQLLRNDFAL